MFKKLCTIIALLTPHLTLQADSNLTRAGDALQIVLPIAAFSTTLYVQDPGAKKEFAQSLLSSVALTHLLKYAFQSTSWGTRPNGGSNSFPSGHTASAFQGAFFLQQCYGWSYSIIPIGLAALTGYSRVEGDYHHWRDVAGGMILAYAVNWVFVNKYFPVETVIYKDNEFGGLCIKKRF